MALPKEYVPILPFPDFKWRWATLACTEGLNDPVVLLGVLARMRKLEGRGLRYSSPEFARELQSLARDIGSSVTGIDLANRVGERNIIRNSGQYWKATGLISSEDTRGQIMLTDFGRKVADREISQTEFAAVTIRTLTLPNSRIQSQAECEAWKTAGIVLHPLMIVIATIRELYVRNPEQGYLTPVELMKIIVPLSSAPDVTAEDYANFIVWNRDGVLDLSNWPSAMSRSNDSRFVKEFLIFLNNYGYLVRAFDTLGINAKYSYNALIDDEIRELITLHPEEQFDNMLADIRSSDVTSDIERKRVQYAKSRPNQARFRKEVLAQYERCAVSNVTLPAVLEAAHIRPYAYRGDDSVANGLCLRVDIHQLFDAGHLRISTDETIDLSNRARMDYGASIPPRIIIPEFVNHDNIRWRWDNYNGL